MPFSKLLKLKVNEFRAALLGHLIEASAQHFESTSRLVNDEFARPDHSLPLRIAFASRFAGNLSNLRQARHRNLSKP